MKGNTEYTPERIRVKMSCPKTAYLWDILLLGKSYADWLPFDKAEKRLKLFIEDKGAAGRPFYEVTPADKQQIQKIMHIRNAIAHSSDHSEQQFKTHVMRGVTLGPRERNPAGLLRSIFAAPKQTHLDMYIATLESIATRVLGTPN